MNEQRENLFRHGLYVCGTRRFTWHQNQIDSMWEEPMRRQTTADEYRINISEL